MMQRKLRGSSWLAVLALALLLLAPPAFAQLDTSDQQVQTVTLVHRAVAPDIQTLMENQPTTLNAYGWEREVPIQLPDWLLDIEPPQSTPDPLGRSVIGRNAPAAGYSFDGYSNNDNLTVVGGLLAPPDTEGDVGLDYYVQWNNLGWYFYDKLNPANSSGPFAGNIFWQVPAFAGSPCQSDNAGDPIVLFDHVAQQWVFSQFTSPSNPDGHQCFAISTGSNPAGPYNLYDFLVSPSAFNDYPKIGLWTDGAGQSAYVMTTNEFGASYLGVNVTAFERDAMLVGGTPNGVQVTLPYAGVAPVRFSLQPSHLEGPNLPLAGTCPYVIQTFDDETWGNGGANGPDGYQFWNFCLDWANPAASVFTQGPFVVAPNFNAGLTAPPQPGGSGLDPLGQFTMYRFHNRVTDDGKLLGATAHTIDLGGGTNGLRWATFDIPSLAAISLRDTGSLNVGDGLHRFAPSAALDGSGNLGLVYSRSGSSAPNYPSVYFTGREEGIDPPGSLQTESVCVDGTGSQLGTDRWGDYATVSVDPEDDCTFWVTHEYVATTGSFSWNSRICTYRFASCGAPPSCTPGSTRLRSIGAHDGWVRESNETSGVGGAFASGGTGNQAIRVGDHRRDQQYKAILSFDTSVVPAGCSVTSATLQLTRGSVVGTDPFPTFQPLTVDIQSGGFSGNVALEASDFQAAATATGVATMSQPAGNGSLSQGTLSNVGVAAINTAGITQLRLQFRLDDNDNQSRDSLGFRPGENNNTPPVLVLTYQ